jgi:CHAT domain-containing protein
MGRYYQALPFALRSLSIIHTSLGSDHPKAAATQGLIGVLYRMQNEDYLASVFLKSSVNSYQSTRERISRIGSNELRSYTESVSKTYQLLAEVLASQGRLAEAQMVLDMLKEDEQFEFIRRSVVADPRRTRIGYTPAEERWMSRYREITDRLAELGREERALQKQARLGLSDEQKKKEAAHGVDMAVARAAFESYVEQMRKEFVAKGPARSVEFAESSVMAMAELQGLLKDLGDDVVLLQIYLTDEQVNFLLTTPGVQLARSRKIKTQELNRQVAALNRQLRDPKSDPLPVSQALYKLLLAPVAQDLQQAGAKTVMLSLDGVLRYLPFGVLHDGQSYALQRWNLPVYTSLVRERLRDAANANWKAAGLGVTRKHGEFDPLPAVRAEMRSIIRTGATGVLPGEVHLDEAFTAQRLKDVSQRSFPVVHVASHFRFSPGTEVNSFLLLGDGNQLTLGDIRTQNYRFDDVDLLTLSACETGLGGGRDERGREIEGFGVIAQQQGAKAVLATLWNVADQSTAILMGDMYRRRAQGGLSKIEALRQAQIALAFQPRTSHPFYWAPFVLMGNWK